MTPRNQRWVRGEGRGESRGGEVGDVAQDVMDVLEEQEGAQHVGLELGEQGVGEERAENGRHAHGGDDRGNKPDQSSHDEAQIVDASRTFDLSLEGDRRQVPGEDEEHGDAEEAPGQPRRVGMVEQDGDDGEGADALDRADAPRPLATFVERWCRSRRLFGRGPRASRPCRSRVISLIIHSQPSHSVCLFTTRPL